MKRSFILIVTGNTNVYPQNYMLKWIRRCCTFDQLGSVPGSGQRKRGNRNGIYTHFLAFKLFGHSFGLFVQLNSA